MQVTEHIGLLQVLARHAKYPIAGTQASRASLCEKLLGVVVWVQLSIGP